MCPGRGRLAGVVGWVLRHRRHLVFAYLVAVHLLIYYLLSREACPICPVGERHNPLEEWQCPPCAKCNDIYTKEALGWEKDAVDTSAKFGGKAHEGDTWALTDPIGSEDRPVGMDIVQRGIARRRFF